MELTEVVFTLAVQDGADRLGQCLTRDGLVCRVMPGDGSRTVWQVRARARLPRRFADDDEIGFFDFLDEKFGPLEEEFAATLEGGLRRSGAPESSFALTRIGPSKHIEDPSA